MLRVFVALVLLVVSFSAGVLYQRSDQKMEIELRSTIKILEQKSESLTRRNNELKETLNLVKRQIQTDRIAYQTLQESFESFDVERSELKAQLVKQKQLLKTLREKLESGG